MNFLDFDSEMEANQIKYTTLDTVNSTCSAKLCYDKHNRVHNSKGNRKHVHTFMKVWENSKKLWKHSPVASVPTAFLVLPNFHSCFYNLIETEYMFSIS